MKILYSVFRENVKLFFHFWMNILEGCGQQLKQERLDMVDKV